MSTPDPERSFAFLIHDTSRLIRREFDSATRDLELTQSKWRVLATLKHCPGISQTELADRLDIEKAPLGLALHWLEQANWIRRERDPADRRARRVHLLERAEPTIKLLEQRFKAVESNYLRGFDPEEVQQMLESLQIVRQELRTPAAGTETARRGADNYLSVLFECARLLNRRFDARLAELGFTRNEWLALNTVNRREGLRQTEIADATGLGTAALGKLIDSLEKTHWIERRDDPRDRRAKRLFLTKRAHNTLKSMRQRFETLHAALERPLGSERKQHLVSSLGWIRQRLLEESAHSAEFRRTGGS